MSNLNFKYTDETSIDNLQIGLQYVSVFPAISQENRKRQNSVSHRNFPSPSWKASEAKVSLPVVLLNFCSLVIYMYLFAYVSHTFMTHALVKPWRR